MGSVREVLREAAQKLLSASITWIVFTAGGGRKSSGANTDKEAYVFREIYKGTKNVQPTLPPPHAYSSSGSYKGLMSVWQTWWSERRPGAASTHSDLFVCSTRTIRINTVT